jgi:hypothetical protein
MYDNYGVILNGLNYEDIIMNVDEEYQASIDLILEQKLSRRSSMKGKFIGCKYCGGVDALDAPAREGSQKLKNSRGKIKNMDITGFAIIYFVIMANLLAMLVRDIKDDIKKIQKHLDIKEDKDNG